MFEWCRCMQHANDIDAFAIMPDSNLIRYPEGVIYKDKKNSDIGKAKIDRPHSIPHSIIEEFHYIRLKTMHMFIDNDNIIKIVCSYCASEDDYSGTFKYYIKTRRKNLQILNKKLKKIEKKFSRMKKNHFKDNNKFDSRNARINQPSSKKYRRR